MEFISGMSITLEEVIVEPMKPLPPAEDYSTGPNTEQAVAGLHSGRRHPSDIQRKPYSRRTFAQVAADAIEASRNAR